MAIWIYSCFFFPGTTKTSTGHSLFRPPEEDPLRVEMRLRNDSSILKNKFLWAKKDGASREPSASSSYYKDVHKGLYKDVQKEIYKDVLKDIRKDIYKGTRHESRAEGTGRVTFRDTRPKNHNKHLKRLFSKRDTSVHDTHIHRKRKVNAHTLRQPMEEESFEEDITEEEEGKK